MSLNELIKLLRIIEEDSTIVSILTPEQEAEGYYIDDLPSVVQDVISIANENLILEGGQVNKEALTILKAEGFRVIPGERDSFGWVTGLIITKKGNILFG